MIKVNSATKNATNCSSFLQIADRTPASRPGHSYVNRTTAFGQMSLYDVSLTYAHALWLLRHFWAGRRVGSGWIVSTVQYNAQDQSCAEKFAPAPLEVSLPDGYMMQDARVRVMVLSRSARIDTYPTPIENEAGL